MKSYLFLILLTTLTAFACNPNMRPRPAELPELKLTAQEKQEHQTDMSQFLSGAVAYGMAGDRFPLDIANALLSNNSNWVGKCPICDNVQRGISTYKRSVEGEALTRLSKADQEALSSTDEAIRRPAIQALLDRYVKQYYTALAMNNGQRASMKEKLEGGRKRGMAAANGSGPGFFCPSCDGACEMPKH